MYSKDMNTHEIRHTRMPVAPALEVNHGEPQKKKT